MRFSQPPRVGDRRARTSFPSFLNFLTSSPSPARVFGTLVCWKSIKLQFTLEIQCFTIITSYCEGKEDKSGSHSLPPSLFLSFSPRPFGTAKQEVGKIACALPAAACVSNVSYNFSYFLSCLPAVLFACALLRRYVRGEPARISRLTFVAPQPRVCKTDERSGSARRENAKCRKKKRKTCCFSKTISIS